MSKIKLTTNTKEINGSTAYQIQAVSDIPEWDIKEGELGGWVTEGTIIDDKSWVAESSWVIGGSITEAFISENSDVMNSTITTSCLSDVTITESYVESAYLHDVNVNKTKLLATYLEETDDDDSCHFLIEHSRLSHCDITSSSRDTSEESSIILEAVQMQFAIIKGEAIKIRECREKIVSIGVKGKDIRIENINQLKQSSIEGHHIRLTKFDLVTGLTVDAEQVKWNGRGLSTIEGTTLKTKEADIEGWIHFRTVKINSPAVFIKSDEGQIEISYSEFEGDVTINGHHIIKDSLFKKGISAGGVSLIDTIYSSKGMPTFFGDVELSHVELVGESIGIVDFAKIRGYSHQTTIIQDKVLLSEFAVIDNTKSKNKINLRDTIIKGDTFIS